MFKIPLILTDSQIKQLLKQRRSLLEKKAQGVIKINQSKLEAILSARDADLKSEAKALGDLDAIKLIENAEGLDGPRALLQRIASVKNMNTYQSSERSSGKAFWDSHKQFERQMKKRTQIYINQSKQLKGMNQRQRAIFLQIERLQNQMINLLTKARGDPNHIKKAQKYNQQIQKRKGSLKETKAEKQKLKKTLQETINNILQYNQKNQIYSNKRLRELEEIFGRSQNLADFDKFLYNLQSIIENKGKDAVNNRGYQAHLNHLDKLIRDYQLLFDELQRYHDQQNIIFNKLNQSFRESTKFALLQKIYLSGISNKQDQVQLLKKCHSYRKLLSDLQGDRPMISQSLKKINQMNTMLMPIKKAYATQQTRKEQLKRQLKKLCEIHQDLENRMKRMRNYAFEMQQLMRSREQLQNELNDCAQKGNLTEYKSKVKLLEQIDNKIQKQRNSSSNTQIRKQQEYLVSELEKINQIYEDIIQEIIVQDKKMYLGTYINKLQKRLSLV